LAVKGLTAEWPVVLFVSSRITLFCGVFDMLNTTCSVTIGFTLCSIIFIYTPSEHKGLTCAFIPPNITCASVMACRLVRELKLGLFVGPMTELEGAMSRLVFRDLAGIERHGISLEPRGFDDVDKDTGAGERRHVPAGGSSSEADIDLSKMQSRTDG
jgi:hypothetical protein